MSGYSLGEQLTNAIGRIVDLEAELRCTEGDLAVATDVATSARVTLRAARDYVESVWGRAEQAAEQVRRIPAAGVAQAFADLADILGSDEVEQR